MSFVSSSGLYELTCLSTSLCRPVAAPVLAAAIQYFVVIAS